MQQRLSPSQWKSIKPALLIGLALALLQIGSGLAAYYQSKSLLWEGKLQTAQNLSQGLVVAVADQIVLKVSVAPEIVPGDGLVWNVGYWLIKKS